jgi:hypothetical protein
MRVRISPRSIILFLLYLSGFRLLSILYPLTRWLAKSYLYHRLYLCENAFYFLYTFSH